MAAAGACLHPHAIELQTIARWHREGYSELPEYAHLKTLMEAPVIDAGETLRARFPLPRYVVCDHGSSQVRGVSRVSHYSVARALSLCRAHTQVGTQLVAATVLYCPTIHASIARHAAGALPHRQSEPVEHTQHARPVGRGGC